VAFKGPGWPFASCADPVVPAVGSTSSLPVESPFGFVAGAPGWICWTVLTGALQTMPYTPSVSCCCCLQELEVRFLYLSNPRLGVWLEDLAGITELRGLRMLRLAGQSGRVQQASSCTQITEARSSQLWEPAHIAASMAFGQKQTANILHEQRQFIHLGHHYRAIAIATCTPPFSHV
jgi:hypothetical protein